MTARGHQSAFCESNEAGVSLVSLLIAIAIMGIVFVGVSQSISNTLKTQKKFEEMSDMSELRRVLRSRVNCAKTKEVLGMSWSSCNGATKIVGVDESGSQVVGNVSPATTFGPYSVELRCVVTGTGATMRMTVSKGGAIVQNDLFRKVPYLCP